jgi:hypothetical protein
MKWFLIIGRWFKLITVGIPFTLVFTPWINPMVLTGLWSTRFKMFLDLTRWGIPIFIQMWRNLPHSLENDRSHQDLLFSRPEELDGSSNSQSGILHPQFASRNSPSFYSEDWNFATRGFNRYTLPPRIPEPRDVSVNAEFLPPLSGLRSIAFRWSWH